MDTAPCVEVVMSHFSEMLVTNLNGKPGFTSRLDPLMVFNNDGTILRDQLRRGRAPGPGRLQRRRPSGHRFRIPAVQVVLGSGGGTLRAPLALVQAGGLFTFAVGMNTTDMNRDGFPTLLLLDNYFDEHGFLEPSAAVLGGPRNKSRSIRQRGRGFHFVQSFRQSSGHWRLQPRRASRFHLSALFNFFDGPASYAQVFFGDGKGHLAASGPELSLASNYLIAGYFNAGGVEDLILN